MQCASGGADPPQIDEAADIVDEVGKADLHPGALDATVRMKRPILDFWSANTSSTRERITDLPALARRVGTDISRCGGFLWWTFETKPFLSMKVSFAAERYAVSAQTEEPVLLRSRSPSRSRAPSCALV